MDESLPRGADSLEQEIGKLPGSPSSYVCIHYSCEVNGDKYSLFFKPVF